MRKALSSAAGAVLVACLACDVSLQLLPIWRQAVFVLLLTAYGIVTVWRFEKRGAR